MRIVVFGASGFIGKTLVTRLKSAGFDVVPLDLRRDTDWERHVTESDAVVNLAGAPIFGRRWTPARKKLIYESRVDGTRRIVEAMARAHAAENKPGTLVNASAVGYYGGKRGDTILDENAPAGADFLAEVCRDWELEAGKAESHGIRTVILRFGIVLGHDGGALAQMVPPFKAFVGGPIGDGKQWMPWIHKEDILGLILYALRHDSMRGLFNATAPNPVTNRQFSKSLGHALHRPSLLPVPPFALKALFGEAAEALIEGQRAIPSRTQAAGYVFKYPEVNEALRELF